MFQPLEQLMGISIHAPREGGDHHVHLMSGRSVQISIHAPREGGDPTFWNGSHTILISIHAPREGGDCRGDYALP